MKKKIKGGGVEKGERWEGKSIKYLLLLSSSLFSILNPPTSPLNSVFDLPQLSVSFNIQDGGEHSPPPPQKKKYHHLHRKICLQAGFAG